MSNDPHDVVKVAAGEMVVIELYKQGLADAGIEARVMGESLDASFGTAIPNSVELWVHRSDALRAQAVLQQMEEVRGKPPVAEKEEFPRPTSDPRPAQPGGARPHTHYDPDPRP